MPPGRKYLIPGDAGFKECAATAYAGFHVDTAEKLAPKAFHDRVQAALQRMHRDGLFHHDVVAAGKAVSATFVTRTLIGCAGMTYHYQKLRIFAYVHVNLPRIKRLAAVQCSVFTCGGVCIWGYVVVGTRGKMNTRTPTARSV